MKKRRRGFIFILAFAAAVCSGCIKQEEESSSMRSVIYLYPRDALEVSIQLNGSSLEDACTYPRYKESWHVIARPDGSLTNLDDGQEYDCLFREENVEETFDMEEGFLVKGEETAAFLQETFTGLGLIPEEYNTLLVWYLPQMEENPWNLIMFRTEIGRGSTSLAVLPEPDRVFRVIMAYQALEKPVNVREPKLEELAPSRNGFTAIEFGALELS